MKSIGVIFVLALLTVAGELYSDLVLTSGHVATNQADPLIVGAAVARQ